MKTERIAEAVKDERPDVIALSFLSTTTYPPTKIMAERLNKNQTLEQIEYAVNAAKRHGIERAHGFFLVGAPGETVDDIMESFLSAPFRKRTLSRKPELPARMIDFGMEAPDRKAL